MNYRAARVSLLGLLALTLPACGQHGVSSLSPFSQAAPTPIFSDDFNRGSLGPDYAVTAGSVIMDGSAGNPAGSASVPNGVLCTFNAVQTFASRGMTFSVDISRESTVNGEYFSITDVYGTWSALASMTSTAVGFSITGTPGTSTPYTWSSGAFHRFSFSIDPAGNMTWLFDGVSQYVDHVPFASTTLRIGFSGIEGHFDNFSVTSP